MNRAINLKNRTLQITTCGLAKGDILEMWWTPVDSPCFTNEHDIVVP
jgi:hypothetical protein